jgi:ligand-binding sensor domain-containing protein/DNA-binding CsgD family transcriptional regulator
MNSGNRKTFRLCPGRIGKLCVVIAFFLFCAISTMAQARTFSPVGAASGMDARMVVSMIIDNNGFLWVASREGLFRYDGYKTVTFKPRPGEDGFISDMDLRLVYQSLDGDIWVGTNTGGLNRYDQTSGKFTVYRHDSTEPSSILDDSIYGISEGPEGGLWVSTQHGLSRLDRESGRFEHFNHEPDNPRSLSHDWAFYLHLGSDDSLWISTVGGGLNRWNPQSRDFTRFDLAALTQGPDNLNDVFPVLQSDDGRVWAGTREGLVVVSPQAGTAEWVDLGKQEDFLTTITAMTSDKSGRLWITTMARGVLILDMENGNWMPANDAPLGSSGYLPAQPQLSVLTSGEQVIIGTWGSGVYHAPLEESAFDLFDGKESSVALRYYIVTSILAGNETGHPWLGSFGGGPQLVDINNGQVVESEGVTDLISTTGVFDMTRDARGWLFAATTNGLIHFSEDGSELEIDRHDPEDPDGLGEGYVYALLATEDNGLWIGVAGSGLHFRDGDTGTYKHFRHDPDKPDSLSGNFITALADDRPGYIWVGTRSNGLNLCRIDEWLCQRFSGRNAKAGELSHFHVTSLYRDRRGRLWVGTDGGGLNRVLQDDEGKVTGFENWSSEEGLLNNGIMAIEEDVDESLWLSTRHGLSRINTMTGSVINFVSESGLPVSHYNTNASAADSEYIYFGSVDGLLSFPKGSLLQSRQAATVRVTGVQRAAKAQQPIKVVVQDQKLSLPYGEVITLEFAVLDFSESAHQYAYRLNASDPWTDMATQRQIILHGLAPGVYEFQARGRDTYGLWGESEVLALTVVPPFWMTMWFRLLVVAALILLGVGLQLVRTAGIRRTNREVLRLSGRREQALEEALGGEAELAVLTPRQKEILQLIAEGQSTRQIGETLGVSVKTVETHRANLMERLEIYDIAGLVRLAVRSRLVSPLE